MEYIDIKNRSYTKEDIVKISKIIKSGGVCILPTDTVYGIVADMMNEGAVKKIYELKKRKLSNPMNILVSNMDMIKNVTKEISDVERKIIDEFFPGALTIILKKKAEVSDIITAGLDTVGIRMPKDKFLIELIEFLGMPIVATSCNLAEEPPIESVDNIVSKFPNDIDLVASKGEAKFGVPSTIVRVEEGKVRILRNGPISESLINKKIKERG